MVSSVSVAGFGRSIGDRRGPRYWTRSRLSGGSGQAWPGGAATGRCFIQPIAHVNAILPRCESKTEPNARHLARNARVARPERSCTIKASVLHFRSVGVSHGSGQTPPPPDRGVTRPTPSPETTGKRHTGHQTRGAT